MEVSTVNMTHRTLWFLLAKPIADGYCLPLRFRRGFTRPMGRKLSVLAWCQNSCHLRSCTDLIGGVSLDTLCTDQTAAALPLMRMTGRCPHKLSSTYLLCLPHISIATARESCEYRTVLLVPAFANSNFKCCNRADDPKLRLAYQASINTFVKELGGIVEFDPDWFDVFALSELVHHQ